MSLQSHNLTLTSGHIVVFGSARRGPLRNSNPALESIADMQDMKILKSVGYYLVQFHLQRQVHRGNRCIGPRLVPGGELGESPICPPPKGVGKNLERSCRGNSHCTSLERSRVVPKASGHVDQTSVSASPETLVFSSGGPARGAQKSKVEIVRMESLWEKRLTKEGWSSQAIKSAIASLATTTWSSYNLSISNFLFYLREQGVPWETCPDAVVVNYLQKLTQGCSRSQAKLTQFSAALSCYGRVVDRPLHLSDSVHQVFAGTVKIRMVLPLQRSRVMPVNAFFKMFSSWKKNSELTLELLRLKTITLMALCLMLRPSDITPRSGRVFRRSAISSDGQGGLEIYFHGIKNDTSRDGFRVILRLASDVQLCPVDALCTYMSKTVVRAGGREGPVFLTLNKPFRALSATAVTNILNDSIFWAGLDRHVYSAKNFRPTGATGAISTGMKAREVQVLGRWKSEETFKKHIVVECALRIFCQNETFAHSTERRSPNRSPIWDW